MDDLMMMHSEPPKPKLVAMELPGQPGVYWPALKFQSHKDMRMWGRELQSNRNQCSLGELLVRIHIGYMRPTDNLLIYSCWYLILLPCY